MYSIDFKENKELRYWAKHWNLTIEQVKEAAEIATNPSLNGMQQALFQLGYLRRPDLEQD